MHHQYFQASIRFIGTSLLLFGMAVAASANTYTVTTHDDFGSVGTTLRDALFQADVNPGPDIITFAALTNSITVYSPLTVNGPVLIEGKGQTIGARYRGFNVFNLGSASNGSTVTALAIVDGDVGISFHRSSACNIITNCRIGTDWDNVARGNNIGISLAGNYHRIGGNTAGQRNIISGNLTAGIQIKITTGSNPVRNTILGNYIGLNSTGTSALPNPIGIDAQNSVAALIGGNISTEANVISGNTQYGICFTSTACMGNTIAGNVIGLNPAMSSAIPNQVDGIRFVSDSSGNFIGMPNTNFHNVIAGNTSSNVRLGPSANYNFIRNNYIGVNSSSTAGFSSVYGVYLEGTTRVLVGGARNGLLERNIISGNRASTSAAGICIVGGTSNSILGNYIGTDDGGNNSRPNYDGVRLEGSGTNTNIGGANAFSITLGNIISGNDNIGINLLAGTQHLIKGNWVGLNAAGTTALSNGQYGVYLGGSLHYVGSIIVAAQEQNVISGNTGYGMNVTASNCRIYGNWIGSSASGTATVNNGNSTAMLCIANYNRMEANSFADRVEFTNFAMGNTLVSNKIGVLPNGSSAGVSIAQGVLFSSNASGNFIGIDQNGKGNMIANIVGNGVEVNGSDALRNMVCGNTILAVGGKPIGLVSSGNANYPAPTITFAVAGEQVYGTANPGDYIEVFIAENGTASGGCTRFLGRATTDGSGHWSVYTPSLTLTDYVCASATSPSHNTSEFSAKAGGVQATHTPTASPTQTRTMTRTATVTPTITPTSDNPLIPYDLKGKTTIAFPNPGKQKITFLFHFYQASKVKIDIFNINGERVAVLTEGFPLGQGQTLTWDCKNVAMGIYFACVHIDGVEKQRVRLAVIH